MNTIDYKQELLAELELLSKQYFGSIWNPRISKLFLCAIEEDAVWLPENTKEKLKFLRLKAGGWWFWNNGLYFEE